LHSSIIRALEAVGKERQATTEDGRRIDFTGKNLSFWDPLLKSLPSSLSIGPGAGREVGNFDEKLA